MSNFGPKATPKLSSFITKTGARSQSEPGGPGSIRKNTGQPKPFDLMPQGKALNVGVKGKTPFTGNKYDIAKLAANESDERYQYLLKRAIIRRVEEGDCGRSHPRRMALSETRCGLCGSGGA